MKFLFFLIIFLIPIGSAFAESGQNFDITNLGNGMVRWDSHYERVFDGTNWQNYILIDDGSQIRFDSAAVSFKFDKNNCDFKLYDIQTNELVINSYKFGLSIDSLSKPVSGCTVIDYSNTNDALSFEIDYGDFQTFYELNPSKGLEWTHEITNNEGKESIFTITETCQDCNVKKIEGNKIDFGSYTLDTKNETHQTLKDTRQEKGDYIIEFEKTLAASEALVIDPIFTSNNPTLDGTVIDQSNNDVCNVGSAVYGTAFLDVVTYSLATAVNDCTRGYFEYDVTSIPDTATVLDVDFSYHISSVYPPLRNCDYVSMGATTSSDTAANIFTAISGGTVMLNNDATCTTGTTNRQVDFGPAGNAQVQARLVANSFNFGIKLDNETLGATTHGFTMIPEEGAGTPIPTLTILYSAFTTNRVNDLIATDIRGTAVDLSWSTPSSTGTISGYQINKTTPWNSNVATIVVNNTNSPATTYTVPSLTGSTQYSFRVGPWTDLVNASGNVLNVTTDIDETAAFTPGTLNITASGIDIRTIKYTRTDINSTSLFLNVTAPNTYQLACNFYYKFAATNRTYTNIANVSINANEDRSSFRFNHVDNEIIDVLCWDQYTNNSAKYLITQTHFPFQDQIDNFRNGTYGTQGQFGAFDFIAIIGIMVSMMGFNRVNAVVGVIFCAITIGVLSFFGIIQWYSTLTAAFAIMIFWAWSTHRKDD